MAIKLRPRVVDGMVANSYTIHSGPKTPSRPLSRCRMHLSSHNEDNQVADLRQNNSGSAFVGSVAKVPEEKHNRKSQQCSNSSQSIGDNTVKAERPSISC